jgi:hypothetical protein
MRQAVAVRPPRDLTNQFLVSSVSDPPLPEPWGFRSYTVNRLTVRHGPGVQLRRVVDPHGRVVGVLLGDPVELAHRRLLTEDHVLARGDDIDLAVERDIYYSLGGSFLFLLDDGIDARLYLDASGSLSAVYDEVSGRAASTAGVLLTPGQYRDRFQAELYNRLKVRRDGWFPGGLTAHRGVRRLLVNHYLDPGLMQQVRHWPRENLEPGTDTDQTCQIIVDAARTCMDAYLAGGSVSLALTAGNETRLLLAGLRDIASELDFVTVDGSGDRLDSIRAAEIAERFGLSHRRLPIIRASRDAAEEWHARSGHCIGGANMWIHPSIEPLATRSFFIGGLGGEVGRGFFWRPGDHRDTPVTMSGLVNRFGMPPTVQVADAVRSWLPGVANFDGLLQLDLAYLELRLGCWAFAQAYCTPNVRHVHPLISRRSFEAMLSLPESWRRDNAMILHGVAQYWPELLDLPINRFGNWRDGFRWVRRGLRQPHLLAKQVRKKYL